MREITLADLEVLPPTPPTSKALAIVPAERFSLVNEYHELARLSMAQSCAYMILAGVELLALKKDAVHGQWEKLFPERGKVKSVNAATFGFSYETSRRYQGLAEAAKKHVPEIRALCDAGTPIGELSTEQRDRLTQAVRKIGDGNTYQQLALEWGIAKKPRGSGVKGGHNPGDGKDDGEDTPEREAIDIWEATMKELELHGLEEKDWVHLPDKGAVSRERLEGIVLDLSRLLAEAKTAPVAGKKGREGDKESGRKGARK